MLDELKTQYEEGQLSALELFIELKQLTEEIETLRNEIKDIAIEQAERVKGQTLKGYVITVRNGVKVWDFKNVKAYQERNKELKDFVEALKQSTLTNTNLVTDEGEVIDKPLYHQSAPFIVLEKPKR